MEVRRLGHSADSATILDFEGGLKVLVECVRERGRGRVGSAVGFGSGFDVGSIDVVLLSNYKTMDALPYLCRDPNFKGNESHLFLWWCCGPFTYGGRVFSL